MSLDVHLNGRRIGALYPGQWQERYRGPEYSFAYSLDVVQHVPLGTPLLSYSLPVRGEPYGPAEIHPFVEGLLPEGERRAQIAHDLEIDPRDSYSLIAELGADCPGAVTFIPKGRSLLPAFNEPAWLDEDDLEELVGEEPDWLCDPEEDRRMRFALPGERHKLALVYDEQEDRWGWPAPGVPSTHIVKPQSDEEDAMAFNEMVCTMALREMGLLVAHAELTEIAGRPCLVSRRFDRWGTGEATERLHQESFCQALGYRPGDLGGKGPGFAESRALLEAIGEGERSLEALFAAAYCNFLLGNYEHPHGKSSAILYTEAGPVLAPFYDIASTMLYADPTARYPLAEVVARNSCLVGLAPIGIECGFEPEEALELAVRTNLALCKGLTAAASRAHEEGWYLPLVDDVQEHVSSHLVSLREELQNLKPS
jgi:serine/threonine-protein kinase HipA